MSAKQMSMINNISSLNTSIFLFIAQFELGIRIFYHCQIIELYLEWVLKLKAIVYPMNLFQSIDQ